MIASEFSTLLHQSANGSESAAQRLLQEYGPTVLRAVRLRLGERLRRDYDSADFAQAVWQSFFTHLHERNAFENPKALCAYLARMAERKILLAVRLQGRRKRDSKRRQELDSALANDSQLVATDGSPSQRAIAAETWERLMASLSLRDQKIVHLRLEGRSRVEIAQLLGVAESTIRRVLSDIHLGIAEA
jgi:RNA polymerase sigma factor (sigma-70 family)